MKKIPPCWQEIRISKECLRIPLPQTRQIQYWSCGGASLRSIIKYWTGFNCSEIQMNDIINASVYGTQPENVVKGAHHFNLSANLYEKMGIQKLKKCILNGQPVMCPIQAWRDEEWYDGLWGGHWITVIGFNEKFIIFQDPELSKFRGAMPIKIFNERWIDVDYKGNLFDQYGIAIYTKEFPVKINNLRKTIRIC